MTGRIAGISGPTVTAELPGLRLYERVRVGTAGLTGEVVRLEGRSAVIQVYESTYGLSVGEPIVATGMPLSVTLGPGMLGAMFDGLQRPLDQIERRDGPFLSPGADMTPEGARFPFTPAVGPGMQCRSGSVIGHVMEGPVRHVITCGPDDEGVVAWAAGGDVSPGSPVLRFEDGREMLPTTVWPVRTPRPVATKLPPLQPLVTGQRIIDFLFPLVRGCVAIVPGGFGTGKTILEQAVAKFADVDVVVYVGCGERGNEMAELIGEFRALRDPATGRPLMERTVLVVNTSNMPVAAREASIFTAVTIAEYYRDMGMHVLFLADSLSRWAEALREISSSLEEMPGEEGYPVTLSSRLAAFAERAGMVELPGGRTGSLSMLLSVSPPGGDFTEPVTQACLRTAGALLMLDTSLAHRRHYPAINWFQSYSLYETALGDWYAREVDARWPSLRQRCRELLAREDQLREIAEIVGAEGLQDADRLLMITAGRIRGEFLAQNSFTDDACCPPSRTAALIAALLDEHGSRAGRLAAGERLDDLLRQEDVHA